ncbi:ComEA family DNA-binding protein [uncultured Gilvimarinus sp.]|uniref:ComEA family DNA-binding protein n=1 Tax=uncultured Gilvimarinus sp. TaxID=1689143 RepID=UPI0030EEC0CC|tara:strand:- start:1801 stop:2094 length:294 start_codon:yes stop_codon:yes gene_type:complete
MKRLFCSFVIAVAVTVFAPLNAFAAGPDTEASVSAPININTADVQALSELKGIGESKAQAIIAWREQNGPFDSVDELLQVKGIGEATLNDIRKKVVL